MTPRSLARSLLLTLLTAFAAACGDGPCPEGSPGCACTEDGACDSAFGPRLQCVAGTCERLACTPGERGCACPTSGACAAGTQCFDGICDLPEGHLGQACLANRTCKPGARCDDGVCSACALGTEGCACADGACSAGGQCVAGMCTGPAGFVQPIPDDPKCYTPCRADYVSGDGTLRRCARDGLFEGCVDGNVCRRGTCLPEAMAQSAGLEAGEGIDLSGGAGFEMFTLYQALQYYERAFGLPSGGGYVTNETVSAYFSRVIRASTQKAKTQAEIARRYQSFNRTELATRVALRAYTAAYLEAMVASNVLSKLRDAAAVQDVPEIERNLRDAALRYRAVLLDMRDLYSEILESSGAAVFGYRPDEVPFPALDPNDINAFERVMTTAKEKLAIAAEKEDRAISGQREFDTDEAAFQSELTQIQLSYDAQIADACGNFVGGRERPG